MACAHTVANMTIENAWPVTKMSEEECWAELASRTLGRLATSVSGQPDIFPVNYAVQSRTILIRTAEGTKLASSVVNPHVAFETDDHDFVQGWSVVVKGQARVLSTHDELTVAERAQVLPWTSTPKGRFIRITPTEITGRRFRFGSEADHLWDFA
jgi:nitroimidazol reductase NimA-like FMN-containing flavoprotein (pyridoxamine 5'-phosphate oxidase superfamily)